MRNKWKVAMATMLMALLTVGCTTTQKYMAGGATAGALVGGIWANETAGAVNTAQGALIGGSAGAALGALVGDVAGQGEYDELAAERDRMAAEVSRLQQLNDDLKRDLADCLSKAAAARESPPQTEYLSLTLLSDVLFEPGKAVLRDQGRQELDRLVNLLNERYSDQMIMIEGHTDHSPIVQSGWKDNWELGCARSLAVLRYLGGRGVAPSRLAASTYAFYSPVATNETVEGRRQNRRSVIAVYTDIKRERAPAQ